MLRQVKERIEKIDYEIMFITNYLFLNSITKNNLNSPAEYLPLMELQYRLRVIILQLF